MLKEKDTNRLVEKYKENYENEKYIKMRNKMKEYNNNADKIMKRINAPPEFKEAEYDKPIITTKKESSKSTLASEELNYDLGAFLATVLEEASNNNIVTLYLKLIL